MFEEDMGLFFEEDEFAITATWTPSGGDPVAGVVFLDNESSLSEEGVVMAGPQCLLPTEQWPGIAVGDGVAIESADLPSQLAHQAGDYVIRQCLLVDDGAIKRLVLARQ